MSKHGFVYLWFDKKNKMYYVGSHWGFEDDTYVCSSKWMKKSYKNRPNDFKRRIISRVYTNRKDLLIEEQRYLDMIKMTEIISTENKKQYERDLNVRYYNLNLFVFDFWHTYENDNKKSIGEKISVDKKGKSTGPCSPEKAKNISEAKKKKIAERGGFSEEHKKSMSEAKKGTKRSEEAKRKTTETLKKRWANNEMNRERAKPKVVMTPEEQAANTSKGLKQRWADPVWAANQKEKLKQAQIKRRSNEHKSKLHSNQDFLSKSKIT